MATTSREDDYIGQLTPDKEVNDTIKAVVTKLDSVTSTAAELNILDGVTSTAAELNILDGVTSTAAELNILDTVTSTAAELNLLDGAVVGNSVASKVAMVDASKLLQTNANNGTAGSGDTAVEYGDGYNHTTVITIGGALSAIAGGADLGVGKIIYTFPAGAYVVHAVNMSVGITQSEGNINADTPDVGCGSVIASGAVNALGGTATFEDFVTGSAAADCTGTATAKASIPTAGAPLLFEAGGSHVMHFNAAYGWAASGDSAATLSGTVTIYWTFLG